MYLVIKNGTQKKSYQCTNTCNKPRVRVSNSYIPLTNNIQSKPKCKINSMEVASYKSYTYTGEQGTITTGTTYLTRASTSNTVYGTGTTTKTTSNLTTFIKGYLERVAYYGSQGDSGGMDELTLSALINYQNTWSYSGKNYGLKRDISTSGKSTTFSVADNPNITGVAFGRYTSSSSTGYADYNKHKTRSYNVNFTISVTSFSAHSTTGTTYQTRASTSGTSYGTKTTNKTLTSSSWG